MSMKHIMFWEIISETTVLDDPWSVHSTLQRQRVPADPLDYELA